MEMAILNMKVIFLMINLREMADIIMRTVNITLGNF